MVCKPAYHAHSAILDGFFYAPSSSGSKGGLGGPWSPRFFAGPLLGPQFVA